MKFKLGCHILDLEKRTHIMGILNVTPDSFSDGGLFLETEDAYRHTLRMQEDGADIIDIGGQSTRPGSLPVSPEEELRRVLPVIEKLKRSNFKLPISIDTYSDKVAEACLEIGVEMVNDISGLRFSKRMRDVIAKYSAACLIMHIKGTPRDMQDNPAYPDLFGEIIDYLKDGINQAEESGISEIVIDPGIGFGKDLEHNLQIINHLDRFCVLNRPILVGVSRKSFIGKVLNLPTEERLEGTSAACAVAILRGANIVRVHDVKEIKRVVDIVDAIRLQ
ncbi:MAG: dihydropteroate synthase [bacterium]|nr:dihydropteroate synthase [bacterium]